MRLWIAATVFLACFATLHAGEETWKKDLGKQAPPLIATGWVGTPVSLDSVRGNAVVLSFWNADVPC